jgi:mono/diheme cytochrome c family protein
MKSLSCCFAILIATGVVTITAAPVSITLPPETGTYKAAAGAELAQANCLTCHSVEYVTSQPPMPRKFWEANVKKMKEKFGAPIPDDQIAKIADYLTATYGVAEKTAK